MNFTSLYYAFFLPLALLFSHLFHSKGKTVILLIASFLFYFSYSVSYFPYLLGIILFTYLFALWIQTGKQRKTIFILSLFCIVGYWIYIKFTVLVLKNPFVYTPIGISFFTLEAVSYLSDVYQNKTVAQKNPFKVALYLSFFPTITSGPIKKADMFLKELDENKPITPITLQNGLLLFLKGLFLKTVLADRISIYTSAIYQNSEVYGLSVLLAFFLYSIQLYADFKGYTDMARGTSKMLGIEIPENFEQPYFATSVKDFWHRWHQSLSTWLKDYIYIPLGGSRCSYIRKNINVLLTFLISGFWHGNGINYLIWGFLHGIAQITESHIHISNKVVRRILTFLFVTFAWVFFGAGSTSNAISLLLRSLSLSQSAFFLSASELTVFDWVMIFLSILILCYLDCMKETTHQEAYEVICFKPAKYILVWILLTGILLSLDAGSGEFMYMQF